MYVGILHVCLRPLLVRNDLHIRSTELERPIIREYFVSKVSSSFLFLTLRVSFLPAIVQWFENLRTDSDIMIVLSIRVVCEVFILMTFFW